MGLTAQFRPIAIIGPAQGYREVDRDKGDPTKLVFKQRDAAVVRFDSDEADSVGLHQAIVFHRERTLHGRTSGALCAIPRLPCPPPSPPLPPSLASPDPLPRLP